MLSPQPKRNRISSPARSEPLVEVVPQSNSESAMDNAVNPEGEDPFIVQVVAASIFVDDNPSAAEPVSTPTIGPNAVVMPSPEANQHKSAPQGQSTAVDTKIQKTIALPGTMEKVATVKFEPPNTSSIKARHEENIQKKPINSDVGLSKKKRMYHLEEVKNDKSGLYICVTTEEIAKNHLLTTLSTKVTIPLPQSENAIRKEKASRIAQCCANEMDRATQEKKYINHCTAMIRRVFC